MAKKGNPVWTETQKSPAIATELRELRFRCFCASSTSALLVPVLSPSPLSQTELVEFCSSRHPSLCRNPVTVLPRDFFFADIWSSRNCFLNRYIAVVSRWLGFARGACFCCVLYQRRARKAFVRELRFCVRSCEAFLQFMLPWSWRWFCPSLTLFLQSVSLLCDLGCAKEGGVGKGNEDVESFGHGNDGDSVSSAGSDTGFEMVWLDQKGFEERELVLQGVS